MQFEYYELLDAAKSFAKTVIIIFNLNFGIVIIKNISRTTVKDNDTIAPSFLELKLHIC